MHKFTLKQFVINKYISAPLPLELAAVSAKKQKTGSFRSDPAFYICFTIRLTFQFLRCLLTSYMSTAAATAAFRDSALPRMGMITK